MTDWTVSSSAVERSVHWHAAYVARHEERHIAQLRRTLRAAVARG